MSTIYFSILIGIMMGQWNEPALHPGMQTGVPTSDAEFFASLNWDVSGLSLTHQAVQDQDYEAARSLLYAYIKKKFRNANYYQLPKNETEFMDRFEWRVEDSRHRFDISDPEQALAVHVDRMLLNGKILFHSTGHIYTFDPCQDFDFIDFDPLDREYHEPLQLYAFYDIEPLRYRYAVTQDPRYVSLASQMVASYCHWFMGGANGPVAEACDRNASLTPWDNWSVPRRMRNLVQFLTFLEQTDVPVDLVIDVLKIIREDELLHIRRTDRWRGNWTQYMCGDGAGIALMFYEFQDAQTWFDSQLNRIFTGAKQDLMPDGCMADLSTSYTDGYIIWMRNLLTIQQAFTSPLSFDIPGPIAQQYERTFEWQINMRKPNGEAVMFNDTGYSNRPDYYGQLALDLFSGFKRQDFLWFASHGVEGAPPSYISFPPTSDTASYAGMYAMRSGWDTQARYLVCDMGPSYSHAHPDFGSFILHAYGADLIEEGGCAAYGSEAWEHYSRSPWAHNILGIDGSTQPNDRPEWKKPLYQWITNPRFDFTWGTSHFIKADPALLGVVHTRSIYFAKPDYFLVLDSVSGSGEHNLRMNFQLAYDVMPEVQHNAVLARSERGAYLWIQPFDARCTPQILTGQTEPRWEGWMNKIPHSHQVEPAPSVVYEQEHTLPAHMQTLLFPQPHSEMTEVSITHNLIQNNPAWVRLSITPDNKAYQDTFWLKYDSNEDRIWEDELVSFQGKLVQLREPDDEVSNFSFIQLVWLRYTDTRHVVTLRFPEAVDGFFYFSDTENSLGVTVYLDRSCLQESLPIEILLDDHVSLQQVVPCGMETRIEIPIEG